MSALDIKYNKEMCDLFLIYFSLLCYNYLNPGFVWFLLLCESLMSGKFFCLTWTGREEVNKGARGGLEKANLSRQATDRDRSLEMVCCFALKFCWLTLVLKNQENKFGVMMDTLSESRLGRPLVRLIIIRRLLFLYLNQAYLTVKNGKA